MYDYTFDSWNEKKKIVWMQRMSGPAKTIATTTSIFQAKIDVIVAIIVVRSNIH